MANRLCTARLLLPSGNSPKIMNMFHAWQYEDDDPPSLQTLFESKVDLICPFGDIVLVVNDESHPTAKFQVSSCILAMASKVFTALFSKNFSEGHRMCSREPGEIVEIHTTDTLRAMKQLLRLLHHVDPLESWETIMPTSTLLDLAIIIDKYDCIEALRLPFDALLAKYIGDYDNLDHLIAASVLLDQPEHFRRLTKKLASTTIYLRATDVEKECLDLFPPKLVRSISCQQNIARKELATQVSKFIDKFNLACEVANRQPLLQKLLSDLKARGLWPLEYTGHTMQWFCCQVEEVSIPVISTEAIVEKHRSALTSSAPPPYESANDWGNVDGGSESHFHGHTSLDPTFNDMVSEPINAPTHHDLKTMSDTAQKLIVGVCLDCIQDRKCRKRHRYHWADSYANEVETYWLQEGSDGGTEFTKEHSETDQFDVFLSSIDFPGYWEDVW